MPTYGSSGQPAQSTFNYDAVMSTSLGNYRNTLTDNISTTNLIFHTLKKKGFWESADGGAFIAEDLMYGLGDMDSYDSYDELPLTPNEGITQAQFVWRQLAAPFSMSEKERKMNKHRIVSLITSKLKQVDITMQEGFAKHFIQGQLANGGAGNLYTAKVSGSNGSSSVDPLGLMVMYNPATSVEIGGINQSTQTWWRNNTKTSAATTYDGLLAEILNMKNTCSKGPGGAPDIMFGDQLTVELLTMAYYKKFQTQMKEKGDFPFPVIEFQGTLVSWDQYMPDVESGSLGTTYGSLYFLNSEFMKIRYESETNFVPTDMVRPVNQDVRVKHVLWMGNTTVNNRRKLGVLGKIARSLT